MRVTTQKPIRALAPTITAIILGAVVSGCGGIDITQARIQTSLPVVFTNLYIQQQADLGHPGLTPAALQVKNTTCDKGGPSVPDHGAGFGLALPTRLRRRHRNTPTTEQIRAQGPAQRLLHRRRLHQSRRPPANPEPSREIHHQQGIRVRRLL